MLVTYIGPHEAVIVPDDSLPGGELVVEQGETVDLPAAIANGLLEQGTDSAEDNPQHQPQWKKASKGAASKAAANETAEQAEKGDDA